MTRRGLILPVVLMILLLLGLLVAIFAFRVNADLASTQATAFRFQTRLAAEAGIDLVKLLLRDSRWDVNRWYHNPAELHRIVVWVDHGNETVWGSNDEFDDADAMVYRFSIVADDPTDDEDYIRLGITDESSKLNLNTASEAQLLLLVRAAVGDDEEINPQDIVNAILDWRDKDQSPRGEAADTEGLYYRRLPKPYKVRNGPFDTVEELLLVKGVTGRILYGEDFDRNGLLTPNEDDGDKSFPPDNEDGLLNQGLYPYMTVLSSESNVSNDNRDRVYLLGQAESVREELGKVLPDDADLVDAIVSAVQAATKKEKKEEGEKDGGGDKAGGRRGNKGGDKAGGRRGNKGGDKAGGQRGDKGGDKAGGKGGGKGGTQDEGLPGAGDEPPASAGDEGEEGEPSDEAGDGAALPSTGPEAGVERDDGKGQAAPIRSPASVLLRALGEEGGGGLTLEHLAVLMDRTTTLPPEKREIPGLININTAPPPVLRCIDGLTGEQIEGILEMRGRVPSERKVTAAWLVTEGVIDLETFERIAPQITARGQQFTIESLGYADHIGMVTRLQAVVDMVGPIAQTIYYRDLTYIGGHFPIREEDLERTRAR